MSKSIKSLIVAIVILPVAMVITWYLDSISVIPDTRYLQSLSMLQIIELNKKYGVAKVTDLYNPDKPSDFADFLDREATVKQAVREATVIVDGQKSANQLITKINGEYVIFEGVDPTADLKKAGQDYLRVEEVSYAEPDYILQVGPPDLSASVIQAERKQLSPIEKLRQKREELKKKRETLLSQLKSKRSGSPSTKPTEVAKSLESSQPAGVPPPVPTPTPQQQTEFQNIARKIVSQLVNPDFTATQLKAPKKKKITIGVVDSGVNNTLLSGTGKLKYDSILFGNAKPIDNNGHGTHVNGLIMAIVLNFLDQSDVDITFVSMQAFDGNEAKLSEFARAVDLAERLYGVNFFNFSFGAMTQSEFLGDAIERLKTSGVHVVAAAGNFGVKTAVSDPALREYVLSVSSIDTLTSSELSNFSNHNPQDPYELTTIGRNIESFYIGDTTHRLSGTSQASPIATAFAVLYDLTSDSGYSKQNFVRDCTSNENGLNKLDVEKCLGGR